MIPNSHRRSYSTLFDYWLVIKTDSNVSQTFVNGVMCPTPHLLGGERPPSHYSITASHIQIVCDCEHIHHIAGRGDQGGIREHLSFPF